MGIHELPCLPPTSHQNQLRAPLLPGCSTPLSSFQTHHPGPHPSMHGHSACGVRWRCSIDHSRLPENAQMMFHLTAEAFAHRHNHLFRDTRSWAGGSILGVGLAHLLGRQETCLLGRYSITGKHSVGTSIRRYVETSRRRDSRRQGRWLHVPQERRSSSGPSSGLGGLVCPRISSTDLAV
jgi:hypothetical protein